MWYESSIASNIVQLETGLSTGLLRTKSQLLARKGRARSTSSLKPLSPVRRASGDQCFAHVQALQVVSQCPSNLRRKAPSYFGLDTVLVQQERTDCIKVLALFPLTWLCSRSELLFVAYASHMLPCASCCWSAKQWPAQLPFLCRQSRCNILLSRLELGPTLQLCVDYTPADAVQCLAEAEDSQQMCILTNVAVWQGKIYVISEGVNTFCQPDFLSC